MTAANDEPLTPEEARLLAWLEEHANRNGGDTPEIPADLLEAFARLPHLLDCVRQLDSLALPPAAAALSETSSFFSSALPREFGPYQLEEEIGRGGMGVVYRARHRTLGHVVALKMIRSCEFATDEEIRRFYQEARAAARLRHANIVSVHDAGELQGVPYLAMQYVHGPTLADCLKQKNRSLSSNIQLLAKVARAVAYLHQQEIVHRDLKPANILLDEQGEPHVTDFGLAKLFATDGERTATGTVIGTPAYMAPEQAWGRPGDIAAPADLYSLGAILYELLTGKAPFSELNPLDQVLRLREAEPLRPSSVSTGVPSELEQICLRCLERNPLHRYASARQLADDLEHYLRAEPITLPPLSLWQRYRRWLWREPALVSHLAGFATMAMVVQGADWWSGTRRESYVPEMTILAIWAILATILQKLLLKDIQRVKLVWVAVDGILFTVAVAYAEAPIESLAVGYAVLIAASGLWYQRTLVWLMTVIAAISFGLLVHFRGDPETPGHYPYLVMGMLLVIGGIVAALVERIRRLLHAQAGG